MMKAIAQPLLFTDIVERQSFLDTGLWRLDYSSLRFLLAFGEVFLGLVFARFSVMILLVISHVTGRCARHLRLLLTSEGR
jgi:hypothetical protein